MIRNPRDLLRRVKRGRLAMRRDDVEVRSRIEQRRAQADEALRREVAAEVAAEREEAAEREAARREVEQARADAAAIRAEAGRAAEELRAVLVEVVGQVRRLEELGGKLGRAAHVERWHGNHPRGWSGGARSTPWCRCRGWRRRRSSSLRRSPGSGQRRADGPDQGRPGRRLGPTAMSPAELVEHWRSKVDGLELAMLHTPEMIPLLRRDRDEAQALLLDAELKLAAERRAQPRVLAWQERERLWEEFCEARRHLRRSRLDAAAKARLIAKFGAGNYAKIPWK